MEGIILQKTECPHLKELTSQKTRTQIRQTLNNFEI